MAHVAPKPPRGRTGAISLADRIDFAAFEPRIEVAIRIRKGCEQSPLAPQST
jgi:hypothetical protein